MTPLLKKSITSFVSITLCTLSIFIIAEPAIISAVTDDVVVNLTVDSGIAITSPTDVTLGSSNMGVSVNSAIGTAVWNVKTNDPDGYLLTIKNASTSPALKGAGGIGNFADYTEAVANTPELWAVDASTYQFGYSVRGTDVNTGTYGSGADCGTGNTPSGTLKYRHASTTAITAATRSSTTTTAGIDTTACFAAGQNGVYAAAGSYSATITATATTL
ncbi:MAG: hypothetical protein V4686_00080 [Patescibacteria group bacterium]